jgi:hypothetical protein
VSLKGLDAKNNWLKVNATRKRTLSLSLLRSVLRRQLEEYEIGVRLPPACEDVSPGAEERPLLEDVIKQRDWEL